MIVWGGWGGVCAIMNSQPVYSSPLEVSDCLGGLGGCMCHHEFSANLQQSSRGKWLFGVDCVCVCVCLCYHDFLASLQQSTRGKRFFGVWVFFVGVPNQFTAAHWS